MCGFGLVCWYSTRQIPLNVNIFYKKKGIQKTRKLKRQFENAMLDRIENVPI